MTKTEQNRVLAWRLEVLREASAAPRNRSRGLPSFWPITPSLLQMEGPIQSPYAILRIDERSYPGKLPRAVVR
jgi:hypothetical protein